MKKLALGSLLLVALGVIGTSFALTTEVKQESGYGHPLIDHNLGNKKTYLLTVIKDMSFCKYILLFQSFALIHYIFGYGKIAINKKYIRF